MEFQVRVYLTDDFAVATVYIKIAFNVENLVEHIFGYHPCPLARTYSLVKLFCTNRLQVIYTLAKSTPFLTPYIRIYIKISYSWNVTTYSDSIDVCGFMRLCLVKMVRGSVATFMPESEKVGGASGNDGKKGN